MFTSLCHDRNDELGYYKCGQVKKKIKCLDRWKGENCLTPTCNKNCNHGMCVRTNVCACKYGWTGEVCNKCIPNKSCAHGKVMIAFVKLVGLDQTVTLKDQNV